MKGIVFCIWLVCIANYAIDFWFLGRIKDELETINRYLKDLADKEGNQDNA